MSKKVCEIDVLVSVATQYFGNLDNLMRLQNVEFNGVGQIACILVRHLPMSLAIDDFVTIEPWNDCFRTKDEVLEHWGITRYFTIRRSEVDALTAPGDVVGRNVRVYQIRNLVVISDTPEDPPMLHCLDLSELGQTRNRTTSGTYEATPDKNAFEAYLSQELGALLLADLDRFVKRKNTACQNLAGYRVQANGHSVD